MTAMIFRYVVPVDDQWHDLPLTGAILHVASRPPAEVEVWAYHFTDRSKHPVRLRVFGTGQPLPPGVKHVGTTIAPPGSLVWHLMEAGDTA